MQSRLKYLNTHMIKLQPDKEEEEKEEGAENELEIPAHATPLSLHEGADEVLTLEPPLAPTPKEILPPLDITPYLK